MKKTIIIALTAFFTLFAQTACSPSSKAHHLAADNSSALKSFNSKLAELREALGNTTDALNAIASGEKKTKLFATYTRKLTQLKPLVAWLATQSDTITAKHDELLKEWDKSLEQIESADIRAIASSQKNELFSAYAHLPQDIAKLNADVSSLNANLVSLQKLLGLSLSEETLLAAATPTNTAIGDTNSALAQIDAITKQSEKLITLLNDAAGKSASKPAETGTSTDEKK